MAENESSLLDTTGATTGATGARSAKEEFPYPTPFFLVPLNSNLTFGIRFLCALLPSFYSSCKDRESVNLCRSVMADCHDSSRSSAAPTDPATTTTARGRRIFEITEAHERRLEQLRDKLHAAETAERDADTSTLTTEFLRLHKLIFDATFELHAMRRAMADVEAEGAQRRQKTDSNMKALQNELRRTHDAMRL